MGVRRPGRSRGRSVPLGDDLVVKGRWRCNIWQGTFPSRNTLDDGYLTTAPAKFFPPNGLGLYQAVGNVWEWCQDVFSPTTYAERAGGEVVDPIAPGSTDPGPRAGGDVLRVMRGGSYLCHDSYCHRYQVAARTANTAESTSANIGFRCANDA